MSVYFTVGEREIWNPATAAGVLFYEQLRALERLAGRPCGVTDLGGDEYQIAPVAFSTFVDALLDALGHTNHAVLLALAESAAAVALGVEARIQGAWRRTAADPVGDGVPERDPSEPLGPIQVKASGLVGGFETSAQRLQPILERAKVLERTFAGGEPAPHS